MCGVSIDRTLLNELSAGTGNTTAATRAALRDVVGQIRRSQAARAVSINYDVTTRDHITAPIPTADVATILSELNGRINITFTKDTSGTVLGSGTIQLNDTTLASDHTTGTTIPKFAGWS
jgi:hypothetical protein